MLVEEDTKSDQSNALQIVRLPFGRTQGKQRFTPLNLGLMLIPVLITVGMVIGLNVWLSPTFANQSQATGCGSTPPVSTSSAQPTTGISTTTVQATSTSNPQGSGNSMNDQ